MPSTSLPNTLLDQQVFLVEDDRYQALLDLLEQPANDNPGLKRLFSAPPPWDDK